MKVLKVINYFFLSDDEEDIEFSDYVWFYGFYIFVSFVLLYTLWMVK